MDRTRFTFEFDAVSVVHQSVEDILGFSLTLKKPSQ